MDGRLGLILAALLLVPAWALALRAPRRPVEDAAWDRGLVLRSALTYALAFNLVFLTQELFLVIPKALTPGLKPVLFHNNHDWTGHHPLENLFQGTGALATVLLALGVAAIIARKPPASVTRRLFGVWIVFHGLMGALPQAIVGAFLPANDVGRAMDFFHLGRPVKIAAALAAIVAIAASARWVAARLAVLAPGRAGMLQVAGFPALVGVAIVIPFRAPGAVDQVAVVPLAIAVIGVSWLMAWAGRVAPDGPAPARAGSWLPPALALLTLLALCQIVLRPGVPFY